MARNDPMVNVRLPGDMRQKLMALAKRNLRSMNSEFVLAVSAWLEQQAPSAEKQTAGHRT